MRDASMIAYQELKSSKKINQQEFLILEFLAGKKKPVSRRQILRAVAIEDISTVAGRVCDLKAKGLVVEDKEFSKCPITGSTVHFVKAA